MPEQGNVTNRDYPFDDRWHHQCNICHDPEHPLTRFTPEKISQNFSHISASLSILKFH